MSRRMWIRRPAGWRENVGAAAVATGVAGVAFYLVRLLLARDPVGRRGPAEDEGPGEREGGDAS